MIGKIGKASYESQFCLNKIGLSNYLRILLVDLKMQQKTLQNLICATTNFILFFVLCVLQVIFFFLELTCSFVDHFVKSLRRACCKKRVQQEPESQQMDFQACCKKRVQQEPESQLMHFYKQEVCKADTQAEIAACHSRPILLHAIHDQTHYREAVTIVAGKAWSRAVQNVKSERAKNRAENNAAKSSANPRAYAQGTWQARRTEWAGTKRVEP